MSAIAAPRCLFNDCPNPPLTPHSLKCAFHKSRGKCRVDACLNQVYARRLCVRHGGKKLCQRPTCTAHARGNAFCLKHGGVAKRRVCQMDGCPKLAHANHKCVAHGGGRYCKSPGCTLHARFMGLCLTCNADLAPIDIHPSPTNDSTTHCSSLRLMDAMDWSILQLLVKEDDMGLKGALKAGDRALSIRVA
ncbi:Aste57867_24302 [Aphanomyces stellatus]|uniref:Aste57867_24302 protein n=1 Tax=Aphanomyces stellatus TaxID=120398 RepID=A0A485LRP0_9STRA|nr:hypothetical protein As57867_024227 [Aphanomyces stellatus]VFU00942.1 Aste57867_24302 [Aphanomyces stellatus]